LFFLFAVAAQASAHGTITIMGAPGGTGEGTITVTHYGSGTDPLDCHVVGESASGDCTTFSESEELEFHATPEGGSTFEKWEFSGEPANAQCALSPTSNPCEGTFGESYSATLKAKLKAPVSTKTLTITKVGMGTLECKDEGALSFGACAASYDEHHIVKIKEAPGAGFSFGSWSEFAGSGSVTMSCSGAVSECEVKMDADVTGKATFPAIPPPTVTMVNPDKGSTAGGQTVTITGTNLGEATQVKFGTTTVSAFDSDTPTEIVLQVPSHAAGQFDVTVSTAGGTSTTNAADEYTYVAPPAVTGLTPVNGSTAGGNEVQISGLRLAGATRVEFGTTVVNAPFIEDTQTTIKLDAPTHTAGTIDVRVTTIGGTSGAFSVDRYTYETPVPSVIEPVPGGASVLTGPPASTTNSGSGGSITPLPTPRSSTKPRPLTRAQKLALALKACAKKPMSKRQSCRTQAEKRYGPIKPKSKSKTNNKKKRGGK
jgi:hypothetical protein